jgi:hypothetical protein
MTNLPPIRRLFRDTLDVREIDWLEQASRAIGDISITYLATAQNLADLADIPTSLENIGLGLTDSPTFTGLTLSADLVTTSTVDGRDVSVDGAKLDGIEASATADQTGAEIKAAYEVEANAFTDAQFTKLAGIEALADVTDTANVTSSGALMDSEMTDIAAVKALDQGVATTDSPNFVAVKVGTVQVVSGQGSAVADASGGSTVDTEARAAINDLLARLRTHGLIAT